MMYPPCPPWAGWYGLWALPPMYFHPGWSGPAGFLAIESTTQEMTVIEVSASSNIGASSLPEDSRSSRAATQAVGLHVGGLC
jgi:hypothetical protein